MDSDDDYEGAVQHNPKRRSKRAKREPISSLPAQADDPDTRLLRQANSFFRSADILDIPNATEPESGLLTFEAIISPVVEDLLRCRHQMDASNAVQNDHGHLVRPISHLERDQLVWDLARKQNSKISTGAENILLRRLTRKQTFHYTEPVFASNQACVVKQLPLAAEQQSVPPGVLETLYAIKTTSFQTSFASRMYGCPFRSTTVFFQDWETMSPWMELMADVMDHHRLSHPSDEVFAYTWSPITYTPLYDWHLTQVHDLLERVFWPGIDVSDSVRWEPEQCSVVALYKNLVVGCAFLSETVEPYVTYIAVRAGWEGAGIATFMLYHLIKQNPNRDISLHVSATNSAMLLYNRFGFKAEEFVMGFYDDYLDEQSKLCKNALRLRYRR
ncbi:GNAT family acetyltransferase [Ceratobasidium sp. AG-Ba]|nr:GNAT family acetyltransferase [Ceratobasidium sp. AG-Ba]